MSSGQRKRPGGAADSSPARKRSRLLPSSAAGTLQTEPIDLEEGGAPAFEPAGVEVIDLTGEEVIDLTGEEVIDLTGEEVIDLKGDEVIDLTGEEVIDLKGDEVIDLTGDEVIDLTGEEVIDLTGEEDIDVTGEEVIDRTTISSEPEVITISDDESPVDREQSQQQPHLARASENSAEPLARNDEEEPREDDGDSLLFDFDLPYGSDEASQLPEAREEERRNVTLNSQEQVDGSGNGAGANDAPVADSAPAEQRAEEEDTESSDAQQGVVIRCPICWQFYSEIMQRGRQLMATLCGHVFCSRCLPLALDIDDMCPTCKTELTPDLYHPIYL